MRLVTSSMADSREVSRRIRKDVMTYGKTDGGKVVRTID